MGQGLGQCTHLSPTAAWPWGTGAPSSAKTEEQKAPCRRCRAGTRLQVWTCHGGCGQDAPRVDYSAPLAAPFSKTTDVFHAVALAVGGVMLMDAEQGRNLFPQADLLGMVRVCHQPQCQHRHSPGSTSPALPHSRDGKQRRGMELGRAPTLSHPAFSRFHLKGIGKQSWKCGSALGRWDSPSECPSRRRQGFECAWHVSWQYKPFALLNVATPGLTLRPHAALGATRGCEPCGGGCCPQENKPAAKTSRADAELGV